MSKLATTIWYGRFHNDEDVHQPYLLPILGWTAFLFLLAALRLQLPFVQPPVLEIHTRILDSLVAGQIWGRQALVSSIEYPTLPSLALFFARLPANLINFPVGHVMVAISQVWGLFYLLRIPRFWMSRTYTAITLALVLLVSAEARTVFYRVDPNWVLVIPVSCALYHFFLWCRQQSLRDLVLLGVNCGIMVFAGSAGIALALLILLLSCLRISMTASRDNTQAQAKGTRLLLWTPSIYTMALVFLANWLIMQNGLFFLKRAGRAVAAAEIIPTSTLLTSELSATSWLTLGGLALCCLKLKNSKDRMVALGIGGGLLVMLVAGATLNSLHLYAPGAEILILLLTLCGILLPFLTMSPKSNINLTFLLEVGIIAIFVTAGLVMPRKGFQNISLKMKKAPSRSAILAAVDKYTPQTRIAYYGFRVPAHYPDIKEERFLARVDFNVDTLRWRAKKEEYLYILIPPPDGTFYARESPLADIHAKGKPWLVLEKAWPGGWQLWRVLNPDKPDTT